MKAGEPKTELDLVREKLSRLDTLLDQGLMAIRQGRRVEAMVNVYGASCLLDDLHAVLEMSTRDVDESAGEQACNLTLP